MTEGHEDYLGDLWDLLPIDPTDFIENPPVEDEAEKAPSSEWAFDHKADISAHHIKYTNANARAAISNIFGADGVADSDIDLDTHALLNVTNLPTKTKADWSKTIGPTGDYANWAAMLAAKPELLAHDVTITIQTGTTLTEQCNLRELLAISSGINVTVKSARYYPTAGAFPTADGAGVTWLWDASVFTVNDYYNDCWILVVDGTGTDNGFVKITDTIAASGRANVASWPGTQPDATSRYIIVGALIDGGGAISYVFNILNNQVNVYLKGLGLKDSNSVGFQAASTFHLDMKYCGVFGCDTAGIYTGQTFTVDIGYCGIIGNNTDNSIYYGGLVSSGINYNYIHHCGISDNKRRGILPTYGGFNYVYNNFGDNNGAWGTYAEYSGQAWCGGSECSGASGNHSNGVGDGSLAY